MHGCIDFEYGADSESAKGMRDSLEGGARPVKGVGEGDVEQAGVLQRLGHGSPQQTEPVHHLAACSRHHATPRETQKYFSKIKRKCSFAFLKKSHLGMESTARQRKGRYSHMAQARLLHFSQTSQMIENSLSGNQQHGAVYRNI